MKKVLIVLNDAILLSVFRSWVFRSQKKEVLLFAKDGKEAMEILKTGSLNLLVTELNLPEIEGLELASNISVQYPTLKIAFFLPTTSAANQDKLKKLTSVHFINKPDSLKDFIQFVSIIEETDFPAKSAADMTIIDFLELVAQQKKTYLLAVENQLTQEKGLIYFEHGLLYDAVLAEFKAEYAIIEILRWQYAKFSFRTLVNKKFAKRINASLSKLVAQAAHLTTQAATPAAVEIITQQSPSTALPVESQQEANEQPSLQSEMAAELKLRFAEAAKVEAATQQLMIKMRALDLIEPLMALQKINNYLAFAIFDMSGEVVINHQLASFALQIEQISANMAMIVKHIAQILRNTGLKKFDFMQMNFESAICLASWVVENQFIAIVLLMPGANNAGLARVHLDKVCDTVHSKLFPVV